MSALVEWMLSAEFHRQKLSLLALCVAAMYVLGGRFWWQLTRRVRGQRVALRVVQSQLAHGAFQLVRLMYYVGIPAAALWRSGRLPQLALPTSRVQSWDTDALLGLLDAVLPGSPARLGASLVVLGGSLGLAVAVWVWYARSALRAPSPGLDRGLSPFPWWMAVREALLLQVFWLFLRGVVSLWTEDRVCIASASVALTVVLWMGSPLRLANLRDPVRAPVEVQRWMLAVWTGAACLVADLFWPLVLWHALWLWLGGRVMRYLSGVKPSAPMAEVGASG